MSERLRILHLEDDPDYSRFVQDLLVQGGVTADVTLVTSRADFDAALAREKFDLILADYSLPDWTGIQALSVVKEKLPQTPFLLVSGTIGEQFAIESLQAGATDYVLKQWPDRLVPAVRRAVGEAEERARRRHAETELIRREKYFRALTRNSLDILTVLNREGVYQYHSPSIKRVLGYEPAELAGKNVFTFIHPEDQARARAAFQHGLQHPDQAVTLEYRIRHRDGHWVYLEAVGQSRLNDPDIAAVVVNSRDVSERKRIERQRDALSDCGRRLSSVTAPEEAARIIQAVADELFGWDIFMLDLYSAEKDEILPVLDVDTINGRRVEFGPGTPSHKPSQLARRIIERGAELIARDNPQTMLPEAMPFGDTSRPSVTLMLAPIRSRTVVIGVLSIHSYQPNAYTKSDLETLQVLADYCGGALERIRAEQAFRESEQRFRDVFEASPDAIFVEDLQGNVLDVNPAACRLHDLSREQLIGKNVLELVPPDQRSTVAQEFKRVAAEELVRFEGESWTDAGRIIPVEIHARRISYAGQPAVLLHVRDISERQRAEAALRSSEMLFHSVWENSVDGMRLTDENGVIVAVNQAYCQLVGMSLTELPGRPFTVVYAAAEQPALILSLYRERFRNRVIERRVERRLTLHNGRPVIFEETSSFVELRGQSPLLLGLFRDVTQQKRLEEQFRQAQKMEAIGQLAGGVAHDFNNILTVIHGHASLLQLAANLSGDAAKSAQQIIFAAERAAGLTRQLLTFSRRQVMQPRRLDLNEIVANMAKMLGRILGEDITLQVDYSTQPSWVVADASMMEQVILNLAVNARDAMPRGGQLTITIAVVHVDDSQVAYNSEARTGQFICLTATDTGIGIAPEIMRRIFEPFFTTKEAGTGKGTGLGLATVYGVVKQHQGWVEVESEPGRGASFRVYIPYAADTTTTTDDKPAHATVRGGTETILAVEDEDTVRELVCNILRGLGYHVLEAASGVKALEVWAAHKDRINLVLTDLIMPDRINGRELAERLWQERPALKVIFTSGYSADVVGKEFLLQTGVNYLQKPYHPNTLALAVRECLDGNNPSPMPPTAESQPG
jgi:two-component system cell cycle sensor histidine kinase/response regulator CckA